jgi:hypothetical protein
MLKWRPMTYSLDIGRIPGELSLRSEKDVICGPNTRITETYILENSGIDCGRMRFPICERHLYCRQSWLESHWKSLQYPRKGLEFCGAGGTALKGNPCAERSRALNISSIQIQVKHGSKLKFNESPFYLPLLPTPGTKKCGLPSCPMNH